MSLLLNATTPRSTPSRSTIWRCSRLRHRPIIGGDDQQREVYASCARYHVVDETLGTGDINKAERADSCHETIGEAQIDHDTARLFLR